MIPPKYEHQIRSLQFLSGKPVALDASDPGTGKTRVAIEDFWARRSRGGKACLVIAPKSLLQVAWADDIAKFAPSLVVSIAYAKNREAAFKSKADVYVTNTDAVRWLAKQSPTFFSSMDTLVVDESSAFKHHTSQRSKALNKIKAYFKYRRLMTGTPDANSITDLWNQIFILDDGQRLGRSFYNFRASVCTPTQVGPSPEMVKWTDRPHVELAVASLINDITIRHKLEDCLDLPEKREYTIHYRLPPGGLKHYQQMEKHALAILKDGTQIDAVNAAAQVTKLLQIASGSVYVGDQYASIHDDRYDLIATLVAERKNTVVFFQWLHQRDKLIEYFENQGITYAVLDGSTSDRDRTSYVRSFQQGLYRAILCHPQSAAHGLTLTRAQTVIWASPTYNLEHKLQGDRRIYRAGQGQKTEIINIIAPGTIEETVAERLANKDERQSSFLSMLIERAQL